MAPTIMPEASEVSNIFCDRIEITVKATHGAPFARIQEVRIYSV